MNGLHGIIFAYEKAPGLRELTEARMPVPTLVWQLVR